MRARKILLRCQFLINQSIFILPKIKIHTLSYIYRWKAKNT